MGRVRHIATSWDGSRVAVAAFERRVAVWDIETEQKISEFDAGLDFGGRRLAITADGRRVVAGAYIRHGISCHDASSGALLWQRKDLKKVQFITATSDRVYCSFDRRAACALDVATGETIEVMRGLKEVCCSPLGNAMFLDKVSRPPELRSIEGKLIGIIERATFAFLCVSFSPDFVLTSESGGPIRCFSLADASEVWRFAPRSGTHALSLGYNAKSEVFMGVFWSFRDGGSDTVVQFDPRIGKRKSVVSLPESPEHGFCAHGTLLLGWDGTMTDTTTGKTVKKLPFPDVTKA